MHYRIFFSWAKVLPTLLCVGLLAACSAATEFGAFDLEADRTGALDKNGFPVFVGTQYDREVPLRRTIERARLTSELQAIADSRKNPDIDVDKRRSELLQKRLLEIGRTHGSRTQAEISAACESDENGVVTCKGE